VNSFKNRSEEPYNIRVLIANLVGVVAELITQLMQQQPDIELLGTVREWHEVNALIGKATIFIIGFEDEIFSAEACLWLLNDYPQLKILILRADGDIGTVYWRTLHCQQMQVISAQTLIEFICRTHSLLYTDIHQHSSVSERN
jgi:DNA-binding NarL/FixJ family response regulator